MNKILVILTVYLECNGLSLLAIRPKYWLPSPSQGGMNRLRTGILLPCFKSRNLLYIKQDQEGNDFYIAPPSAPHIVGIDLAVSWSIQPCIPLNVAFSQLRVHHRQALGICTYISDVLVHPHPIF